MKLYADDPDTDWHTLMIAANPILPFRCPGEEAVGHKFGHGDCRSVPDCPTCPRCDGRGWLYPDTPKGWPSGRLIYDEVSDPPTGEWLAGWRFKPSNSEWESLCMTVWWAMGILEGEE